MSTDGSTLRLLRTSLLLGLVTAAGCQRFRSRATLEDLARSRDLLLAAQTQHEAGRLDEAEDRARDAVEACPQDERAHQQLAEILADTGKMTSAIESQTKAVELAPAQSWQRVRLGEMLLQAGELERAMSEADLALAADRYATNAWNLKARVLEARGDQPSALACWHRSLALDGNQTEVLERLATLYESMGRPARALATWQSIEQLHAPEETPAYVYYRQALALRALDREREAVDRLLAARALDPDSSQVALTLADLQWSLGDRQNARLTLLDAARKWPGNPDVLRLASVWQQAPPAAADRLQR